MRFGKKWWTETKICELCNCPNDVLYHICKNKRSNSSVLKYTR